MSLIFSSWWFANNGSPRGYTKGNKKSQSDFPDIGQVALYYPITMVYADKHCSNDNSRFYSFEKRSSSKGEFSKIIYSLNQHYVYPITSKLLVS